MKIDLLLPFLNVSRSDAVLISHWVINSLLPCPSYPILAFLGEQGAGKSWVSGLVRALVDPNVLPIRSLPRSEHELLISAVNGYVLAFDNVSNLPDWMSDALCRLATGGGSTARRLYSDRDEELFKAVRPMILNGIEHFVTREDLAERCICVTLKHISDEKRMPLENLQAAFEHRRPHILGALLDAAVVGLRNLPDIQPQRLPRMADFARMAMACETALWERGTFEKTYAANREEVVDAGIDADPVAAAVRALVAGLRTARTARAANSQDPAGTVWAGTASDLLEELEIVNEEIGYKGPGWLKTSSALSSRLTRAEPFLRRRGIGIITRRERHERTRMIYITDEERKGTKPSLPKYDSSLRKEHVREEETNQSAELVEDEVCAREYPSGPLD